ncbi:DUF4440 domain-containing protein [Chitinophagaceae bacterium IBVUCB1]|nr:DUF4440 domain-containing protein [Chitinophagaceae bacterium IBVUCB1]
MKQVLLAVLLLLGNIAYSQNDEQTIRTILNTQSAAWNKGSIDEYMQAGYWQHDSLLFVGKSGPVYGYRQTLERYKKSYSDTTQMGKLYFDILSVKPLSKDYYHVLGKWHLKRTIGDLNGCFTLLFRKIKGKWVIVADHSS